jgi:hypothetical protein
MAHSRSLNAAAAPPFVSLQEMKRLLFNERVAQGVFCGRVVAACGAAGRQDSCTDLQQQLQQLQNLEQLANLANALEHLQCPYDYAANRDCCFMAVHTMCSAPGACVHRSAHDAAAAAVAAPGAGAAAAAASTEAAGAANQDVAADSASAAAAAAAAAVAAAAATASSGPSTQQCSSAVLLAKFMAAYTPYTHNAVYAVQLGEQLGVPVIPLVYHKWKDTGSRLQQQGSISIDGSSSTGDPRLQQELNSLERHLLCAYAFMEVQQPQQQPSDMRGQVYEGEGGQQQQQQQPTNVYSQPSESDGAQQQQQQQQHRGPAPLWQLSLLAVLQASKGKTARQGFLPAPVLNMDDCLKFVMVCEDAPDAMLQQLVVPFAGRRQISADGQTTAPAAAYRLGIRMAAEQPWQEGLDFAEAAMQKLQPQLLRWTMQQPQLWQQRTLPESVLQYDQWDMRADLASTQGLKLQGKSTYVKTRACPLVAGLHLQQQAAAGTSQHMQHVASAAAGEAAAAAGSAASEMQRVVETAMLLLQMRPSFKPSLLSQWIAEHLRAPTDTSDNWLWERSGDRCSKPTPEVHEQRVARTKAVLAAVAAAPQVLAGAQQLTRKSLQKVLNAADADLTALVLLWACRLAKPADDLHSEQQQDEMPQGPWGLQPVELQELQLQQLVLHQDQAI